MAPFQVFKNLKQTSTV